MRTKLELAHEWAMKHGDAETVGSRQNMIKYAWEYADAMQAEADKRNSSKPVITEQDKQRAEQVYANIVKPPIKEWQPDWSQAPDVATHWTMRQDGKCLWWKGKPLFDGSCFYDAVGICHTVGYAPSFGYHSDWRNSLRKRPK